MDETSGAEPTPSPLEAAEAAERDAMARNRELRQEAEAAQQALSKAEGALETAIQSGDRRQVEAAGDAFRASQDLADAATEAFYAQSVEMVLATAEADVERADDASSRLARAQSAFRVAENELKLAQSLAGRWGYAAARRDEHFPAAQQRLEQHRQAVAARHAARVAAIRTSVA